MRMTTVRGIFVCAFLASPVAVTSAAAADKTAKAGASGVAAASGAQASESTTSAASSTTSATDTHEVKKYDAPGAPAAADGALTFSPDHIDFGNQSVGTTSVVQDVVISSKTAVKLHDIQAGGDFKVDANSCDIPAGGNCRLLVTFAPKQARATTSSLLVSPPTGGPISGTDLQGEGADLCACGIFKDCSWKNQVKVVGALAALYLLALVVVRWNLVALPTRRLLLAEVEAVLVRIDGLEHHLQLQQDRLSNFKKVLQKIQTDIQLKFWKTGFDAWFWSRGQEISSWGMIHEVEEQLVDFYPVEALRAQLERTESQLRENGSPVMQNLASRIDVALSQTVAVLSDAQRSALEEARSFIGSVNAGLRSDLAALCAQSQATADDLLAMAQRVLQTLEAPATSLDTTLKAALAPGVPHGTPEFQSLLVHTQTVVLGGYQSVAVGLQNAVSAPSPYKADQWTPIICNQLAPLFEDMVRFDARVKAALEATSSAPLGRWRALLSEGLGVLYDRYDTDFASLVAWHNKAMWLTSCGLVLIVSLALALGNGPLFLLGATGGLLSRLGRSLYRQDVQTDYGASWTTLFLSPVVGAITGWAGVLLAALLVKFGILGTLFADVSWNGCNLISLGIALMFGFSERAFDAVLSQLQDKVVNTSGDGKASPPTVSIATDQNLMAGKVGAPYEQALTATGGSPKYTWKLAAGKLPDGLGLDASGKISGAPTTKGESKFSLVATDQGGIASKSKEFTINVTA
jgi:hypothetical protein